MKPKPFLTIDQFSPHATALRAHFDKEFRDPLQTQARRFVWDYWHVPGEFTNLRTPAFHYFPKALYERFHRHLVQFGRLHLGCHDISPPWLTCYVSGCRQHEHTDRPHGPLAFVFSLTRWARRQFSGGETFLRSPRTLIDAKFNRLTLFNPAISHGVREVRGTHDPRYGRLVIHGWFVNPRPFWVGPLDADEISESLDSGLSQILSDGLDLGHGLVSLRLNISKKGLVGKVTPLLNTLADSRPQHVMKLLRRLETLRFPVQKSATTLTLPLICSQD